jgi:hypothetical protein
MQRWLFISIILISGCGTTGQKAPSPEDKAAMQEVVGSVTGQKTSEADLHKLGQQIRNDKDAQSAVESITGAMNDSASQIKYCPVDGERYSAQFSVCPKHNVPLKNLEE